MLQAQLLSTMINNGVRQIPLKISNDLPVIEIQFGKNDQNETSFLCHVDSCAGMNTGNLRLHQWIITTYPSIVKSYEVYNDDNAFNPLTLDFAVPTESSSATSNQLTSVVTYFTRYKLPNGELATISFGLGQNVLVNAIIGLPLLKKWKMILNLEVDQFSSKALNLWFPITYSNAATGFPPNINFSTTDFDRPTNAISNNVQQNFSHSETSFPTVMEGYRNNE